MRSYGYKKKGTWSAINMTGSLLNYKKEIFLIFNCIKIIRKFKKTTVLRRSF